MQNFIIFLVKFIEVLANILNLAIFARIMLSWISMGRPVQLNRITSLIYDVTNPIMNFLRRFPLRIGMIDLSPMIAMIAINFLSQLLISFIVSIPLS